jgi:TrpR family trp operon transcriptional repressor
MSVYRINEISQALASISDEKLIESFLNSLLTKNEINDISSRWELVKLLDDGMSQRNISKQLGLSLCKITRGSRELKKKNSSFKRMIQLVK